jgi:excisionase family DNA binding protein
VENQSLCLSVEEMCKRLSISQASAYALVHTEGFPTVTIGRRMLIPLASLEKWLEEQSGMGQKPA